jgi:DNA-binding CsgD family transcriptional regulator
MGRLTEADLGNIMAFLTSAPTGTEADPLPASTLVAVRDLIGADEAEYFELRRADRAVLGASQSDPMDSVPGSTEAMHAFGPQNPIRWRRWKPADGAMRLSEQIGRRDLLRLEFYQFGMRPNGLRDILKVWLWSSPESVACVQLWRREGEFSRHDQDLLGTAHSGLARLRREATTATWAGPRAEPSLTRREAEVLLLACRGATDDAIATELGMSPGTVGKHLQHAYDTLGVHSRSEALWRLTSRGFASADAPEIPRPTLTARGGRLGG